MIVTVNVSSLPAPGGSKTAFTNPHTGKLVVVDACKRNKEWRIEVAWAARAVYTGAPLTGALTVDVIFYMPRPKGHFGRGRNSTRLRPDAPEHHEVMPDATKLWRSTEDALTGILWADDAQIIDQRVRKVYTTGQVGAQITVRNT